MARGFHIVGEDASSIDKVSVCRVLWASVRVGVCEIGRRWAGPVRRGLKGTLWLLQSERRLREADRWLLESKWGLLENKCIHCLSGWFLNSCCAAYCITLVVGIELCVNAQWKHPKHCVNTWWQRYVNAQWKHPNAMWTHGDIGMWMLWKHPKCYVNTWWKWYVNAQWKHPKHYVNTWRQWYVNTQWKHPNAMWTCGDNGMWMHSENTLTQCEHMVTMVCSAQWKHPKHWTHGENGMWMHGENTLTLCEHSHGDCIMKTWNICADNEQMLYSQ